MVIGKKRRILFVLSPPVSPSRVVRAERFFPSFERMGIACWSITYPSFLSGWLRARYVRMRKAEKTGSGRVLRRCCRVPIRLVRAAWIALLGWRADMVFVQKALLPKALICWFTRCHIKFVYDLDDAVYLDEPEATDVMIRCAWCVFAGSHDIIEYAGAINPNSHFVPSTVPLERFPPAEPEPSHDNTHTIRIGWIGTPSTLPYLDLLRAPLRALAASGSRVQLMVAGTRGASVQPYLGDMPVCCVDRYTDKDIPGIVARMDIGVMPLHDGPKERGKCAFKALLFMAGAKPVVASNFGEIRHIIQDGRNGFLVDNAAEWVDRLTRLTGSVELRSEIGLQGRRTVESGYSTDTWFRTIVHLLFPELDG